MTLQEFGKVVEAAWRAKSEEPITVRIEGTDESRVQFIVPGRKPASVSKEHLHGATVGIDGLVAQIIGPE